MIVVPVVHQKAVSVQKQSGVSIRGICEVYSMLGQKDCDAKEFFAVFRINRHKTADLEKCDGGFRSLFGDNPAESTLLKELEKMRMLGGTARGVGNYISDVCGDGRWWYVRYRADKEHSELHGRRISLSDGCCCGGQISLLTEAADQTLCGMLDGFLPIAVLSETASGEWYLSDMNERMAELVKAGRMSGEQLSDSDIFRTVLSSKRASFGRVQSGDSENGILRCMAGAHPMLVHGTVRYVLVYLIVLEEYERLNSRLFDQLTPSERNVMQYAVEGMDNKTISAVLKISEGTVKRELYACYQKLGVCNRVEALMKFYEY